ncbi:hypothetical protein D3C85_1612610 [compost metagenome]
MKVNVGTLSLNNSLSAFPAVSGVVIDLSSHVPSKDALSTTLGFWTVVAVSPAPVASDFFPVVLHATVENANATAKIIKFTFIIISNNI